MERRIWKVLVLVGMLILGVGVGMGQEGNLLTNPGFEKYIPEDIERGLNEGRKVFGWEINFASSPGRVELISEKEKAHSGSLCLLFHPATPKIANAHIFQIVSMEVESKKKYVFKVWARVDKEALTYRPRISLYIYQYDKEWHYLEGVSTDYYPVTEEWKEFTFEYIPSKQEINGVGCAIAVIDCPVYIDDAWFGLKEESVF